MPSVLKNLLEPSTFARSDEPVRHARLFALGGTGSSSVSLAVSQSAAGVCKLVVLKTLGSARSGDAPAAEGLLDEARSTARMNHPNIVQVFAAHREGAAPVVVMEYLAGQSLAALLDCANNLPEFSLDVRVAIVSRVLSGLHYAHRLRDFDGTPLCVVHGRVSPDNVLISYDGQVKLINFGPSRTRVSPAETRISEDDIQYLAPEQLRGEPDPRVDVFSIGVVLWEMVAKRQLWERIPTPVLLRRLSAGEIPRLRDAVPGVDAELARITGKALSLQRDGRYRTAAEMREDLERYLTRKRAFVSDSRIAALVCNACREQRRYTEQAIAARLSELGLSLSPRARAPLPRRRPWRRILDGRFASAAACASSGTLFAALCLWRMFEGRSPADEALARPVTSATQACVPRSAPSEAATTRRDADARRAEAERHLVNIEVAVEPRDAVLYVDGQQLSSNPLSAAMVWDALPHTIRGEADGFAGFSKTFWLDSDVKLDATLKPRLSATPGRKVARSPTLSQARPRAGSLAQSAYPKVKILPDE